MTAPNPPFIILHSAFCLSTRNSLMEFRNYGKFSYVSHRNSSQGRPGVRLGADAGAGMTGKIRPALSCTSFMSLSHPPRLSGATRQKPRFLSLSNKDKRGPIRANQG
jgi:hypothetical protein